MKDSQGREYAKLTELKAGDAIALDDGFTCHEAGLTTVKENVTGLGFACSHGHHHLSGQLDGEYLIGIYKA